MSSIEDLYHPQVMYYPEALLENAVCSLIAQHEPTWASTEDYDVVLDVLKTLVLTLGITQEMITACYEAEANEPANEDHLNHAGHALATILAASKVKD